MCGCAAFRSSAALPLATASTGPACSTASACALMSISFPLMAALSSCFFADSTAGAVLVFSHTSGSACDLSTTIWSSICCFSSAHVFLESAKLSPSWRSNSTAWNAFCSRSCCFSCAHVLFESASSSASFRACSASWDAFCIALAIAASLSLVAAMAAACRSSAAATAAASFSSTATCAASDSLRACARRVAISAASCSALVCAACWLDSAFTRSRSNAVIFSTMALFSCSRDCTSCRLDRTS
mmetsp:Transcript_35443/g.59732  ORF Transcript_35443/g.59732 Transcript_35443/m.59732 type:complete len:243 (+) Transcript_35443:335-1063(+)